MLTRMLMLMLMRMLANHINNNMNNYATEWIEAVAVVVRSYNYPRSSSHVRWRLVLWTGGESLPFAGWLAYQRTEGSRPTPRDNSLIDKI